MAPRPNVAETAATPTSPIATFLIVPIPNTVPRFGMRASANDLGCILHDLHGRWLDDLRRVF